MIIRHTVTSPLGMINTKTCDAQWSELVFKIDPITLVTAMSEYAEEIKKCLTSTSSSAKRTRKCCGKKNPVSLEPSPMKSKQIASTSSSKPSSTSFAGVDLAVAPSLIGNLNAMSAEQLRSALIGALEMGQNAARPQIMKEWWVAGASAKTRTDSSTVRKVRRRGRTE